MARLPLAFYSIASRNLEEKVKREAEKFYKLYFICIPVLMWNYLMRFRPVKFYPREISTMEIGSKEIVSRNVCMVLSGSAHV